MKKLYTALIALFLAMITLPAILVFAGSDKTFSDNENRALQTSPKLSISAVLDGSFQDKITKYISDQFPARDTWMRLGTEIKKLAGYKDIGGAYLGRDGYYMEKITPEDIDTRNFSRNLMLIDNFAAKQDGIKTTALFVPATGTVMDDKLPKGAELYDYNALFAEAKTALKSITLTDVYDALRAERDSDQVYYRTDHHWTWYGAHTAYEALLPDGNFSGEPELFSSGFLGSTYSKTLDPAAKADSIYISDIPDGVSVNADGQDISLYDLNAANEKDKYKVFFGGNYGLVKITGGCRNGKTLLIIKDSFANSLAPFLLSDYETIIMIDLRYYIGSAQQAIDDNGVDEILFVCELSSFTNDKNIGKLGY